MQSPQRYEAVRGVCTTTEHPKKIGFGIMGNCDYSWLLKIGSQLEESILG